MKASVIVPVLNNCKQIGRCIESLLNQAFDDYEIIIVDNGSIDKTIPEIKRYLPHVRFYQEMKKGSYAARNLGINKARGKILVFTDSDCVAHDKWLSKLLVPFDKKKIVIASGAVYGLKSKSYSQKYCDSFCHRHEVYAELGLATTANMAVRADTFFDQKLLSGADFVLCKKYVTNKNQLTYVEDAVVYHDYSNSFFGIMKKNLFYGKWNTEIRKKYGYNIRIRDRQIPTQFCAIHYPAKLSYYVGRLIGHLGI